MKSKKKFKFILVCLMSALFFFTSCALNVGSDNVSNGGENDYYSQNGTSKTVEFDGVSYSLGYIPVSQEMYDSFAKSTIERRADLPASVDLSSKMPDVKNQGQQNSCVGWATGYAYKTFQEGLDRNWEIKNYKAHQFSPAFIYNQINRGKDDGAYINDALQLVVDKGCATLDFMPYNVNDYRTQPNSSQFANAANYKALSWTSLSEGDVTAMKNHLAKGDSLVVGVPIYPDFNVSNSNPVYDNANGQLEGYHAITICGYNDSKKAFKFINSWGTDWGFSGYGWMSYDLMRQFKIRAYTMIDRDDVQDDDSNNDDNNNDDNNNDDNNNDDDSTDNDQIVNIALNKSAFASAYYNDNYKPDFAVDGNTNSAWAVANNTDYSWITVDLGSATTVKTFKMVWDKNYYPVNYVVYTSVDGSSWNNVKYVTSAGGVDVVKAANGVNARYISISTIEASSPEYYVLYEFEAYKD